MPFVTAKTNVVLLAAIAVGFVLIAGCVGDAERGNPLDPLSDNFQNSGAVAGTVSSYFPPFGGINGVRVRLAPLGIGVERVAITDAAGRFSITNTPAGNYQVSTELDGYAPLIDTVAVEVGVLVELTLPINGIPAVAVTSIHSEHLDRWFPQDPIFQLSVEAYVSDPDGIGDVSQVHIVGPSIGYSDTLSAVAGEPGVYRRILSESELPISAQDMLGLPLQIEATDNQGVNGLSIPVQIVRILSVFPQGQDPAPLDTAGSRPTFVWRMLELPFTFTQRLDVAFVPVPGQEVPVLRYSGIASTDTTFTIPDVLPAGNYSWTVSAVDAFGNLSRSRPLGPFSVTP